MVAVGTREQNACLTSVGTNHDPTLRATIIGQRRCVFHQLELQDVNEETDSRVEVPDHQRDELWGHGDRTKYAAPPAFQRLKYDGAIPAFGRARDDRQLTLEATLLNRRIEFAGFAPRLLYAHIHNTSTISLYAYDRDRLEIGLTREF